MIKGKLGQCNLSKDKVLEVIDKDESCNEEYFWGSLCWNKEFNNFINSEDEHFGVSINRAIKSNLNVGYIKSILIILIVVLLMNINLC